MQARVTLSQRFFYLGLCLMLAASILSATVWSGGTGVAALMLAGAGLALAARLWRLHLRRTIHRHDGFTDLGGYPVQLLRE